MMNQAPNFMEPTVERRTNDDRRSGTDRRNGDQTTSGFAGSERRVTTRRKARRRQIDPTTCERDYSEEEIEFMRAMDDYKRRSGRQFPTWSEVLEVMRCLGYRRVAQPSELEMKTR